MLWHWALEIWKLQQHCNWPLWLILERVVCFSQHCNIQTTINSLTQIKGQMSHFPSMSYTEESIYFGNTIYFSPTMGKKTLGSRMIQQVIHFALILSSQVKDKSYKFCPNPQQLIFLFIHITLFLFQLMLRCWSTRTAQLFTNTKVVM